jgi:hypothetical protein
VLGFIAAQAIGTAFATMLFAWLSPAATHVATDALTEPTPARAGM